MNRKNRKRLMNRFDAYMNINSSSIAKQSTNTTPKTLKVIWSSEGHLEIKRGDDKETRKYFQTLRYIILLTSSFMAYITATVSPAFTSFPTSVLT